VPIWQEIVEGMLELAHVKKRDVVYEENCFAYFLAGHCGFWMLGISQQREVLWRPSSSAY
jgi:hypothetical protein